MTHWHANGWLVASLILAALALSAAACDGNEQRAVAPTGTTAPATATPEREATATPEPEATATSQALTEAAIGDTISGVGNGYDTPGFSMTLLSSFESDIAVAGPYSTVGYYTFTAKPTMKFVILQYRFTNNWVRQQDTPYLSAGEILTAPNGYYYPVWSPPVGIHSEEYAPRPSTEDEINTLGGDSGAYETLLPGESITGRVVFEIPEDMQPVEADIAYVEAKITFTR